LFTGLKGKQEILNISQEKEHVQTLKLGQVEVFPNLIGCYK